MRSRLASGAVTVSQSNWPNCAGCGRGVDPRVNSGNYKKVMGFVRLRKRGANEVALREDLNEFMHADCMEAIRMGMSPGQLAFAMEPEIPGQLTIKE